MYSRLIHTVDHVEGYLREGFDGLDAFLGHTWAVTVTGAPKPWAIKFVEEHEETPRCWYPYPNPNSYPNPNPNSYPNAYREKRGDDEHAPGRVKARA